MLVAIFHCSVRWAGTRLGTSSSAAAAMQCTIPKTLGEYKMNVPPFVFEIHLKSPGKKWWQDGSWAVEFHCREDKATCWSCKKCWDMQSQICLSHPLALQKHVMLHPMTPKPCRQCRLMIWTRQPAGLGAVATEYKAKKRWEKWLLSYAKQHVWELE